MLKYLLALSFLIPSVQAPAKPEEPKGPELTELSQAKAIIHLQNIKIAQLEADNRDLQAKLASSNLTQERSVLEKLFRQELKCKETDNFNWQTLHCEASSVKKDIIK